MSRKNIKGINIQIDGETTGLQSALGGVEKSTRAIQGELRDVERLLKFDPASVELLSQKKELLAQAISNTTEKLETLRSTQEEVNAQFAAGDISEEQYRAFQREIEATEQQLKRFQERLDATGDSGRTLEQVLTETGERLKSIGDKMTNVGMTMSKGVTAPIVAAAAAITGLAIKTGQFADELLDLSAATGIHTDQLQQYRAAAAAAGTDTDAIADSILRMNRQMQDAGEYSKGVSEAAEKYSVSLKGANDQIRDASDVHHDLMMALAGIEDPQERARAGAEAFGRDWEKIAPIVDLGREALEKMSETDVISREQLEAANAFRQSLDELKHEAEMLFMSLGTEIIPVLQDTLVPILRDTVVPALEAMVQRIGQLAQWFGDLDPRLQKAILSFIGIAAAIGPVLVVVGKIVGVVGTALPVIAKVVTALKGLVVVKAAISAALLALTAPVAAVIAIIAALAYIVYILIKEWDTLKDAFKIIWDSVKKTFSEAADSVLDAWDGVIDFFKGIPDSIKSAFAQVWEYLTAPFKRAQETIEGITKKISDALKRINPLARQSPSLVDNVKAGIEEISKTYQKLDGIKIPAVTMEGGAQPAMAGAGASGMAAAGAGPVNNYFNIRDLHVRDDQDIERIARELYNLQRRRDRGV